MHWMGRTRYPSVLGEKTCMAMVIDFLGPSLSDLFYKQQKVFSLKTVLLLADQMLERLEMLHEKGIVHRDIKPGNFVMGTGAADKHVYLIDFGLSHKYVHPISGTHIKYENNVPFRGTHRYASVNAHEKVEQTRRDDLESLAYVLIYFLKGELPWQNLTIDKSSRRQVIGEIKKNIPINQITAALPDEFATYLAVVRKLDFHEKPNYILLRQLFRKCFHERRYQDVLQSCQ
jgi:serine/threonine protein kinase